MSVLSALALVPAPSAATGVTTTAGTMPTWGSWVEVIASTPADTAIAGVTFGGGSFSLQHCEVDFGVGAAAAEVSFGTLRLALYNSGVTPGNGTVMLPVPLGGLSTGVRISIRVRSTNSTNAPTNWKVLYYAGSLDQVSTSTQVLTQSPVSTTTVSLTPSATPWAYTAWSELIASTGSEILIAAVSHGQMVANAGVEFELGTGGSGSEAVITSLRLSTPVATTLWTPLPVGYPIAAGTRLAIRLRKAGTTTTAVPVSVLYYSNAGVLAATVLAPTIASGSTRTPPTVAYGVDGATITTGAVLTAPTMAPGPAAALAATIASGSVLTPPVLDGTLLVATIASGSTLTGPRVGDYVFPATITSGSLLTVPSVALTVLGATIAAASTTTAPGPLTVDINVLGNTIGTKVALRAPGRIYDPAAPTGLALDPDIWCELRLATFAPDESPNTGTVVYRFAFNPLADSTFKEGRLISVGPCTRTWSDIDGNFTPGKTTVVLDDSDGLLRSLLQQDTGTEYFVNREASIFLLSAAGRAADLEPRTIFRGWISDVQATKGRQVRIDISDVVGSQFCGFNLDKTIPSVTLQDVSASVPDALKNQVLPIYAGEHSDRGAVDALNVSAEKGLVPVYDLGNYLLDGTPIDPLLVLAPITLVATRIGSVPPVKSLATVVAELQVSVDALTVDDDWGDIIGHADSAALQALGTVPPTFVALAQVIGYADLDALMGASNTYTYSVSAITATGESNICAPVTVTGPRNLDHDHFIRLTWAHADATAQSLTVAFRICGRAAKPTGQYPTTWLWANNNNNTWVNPETTYDDDGRDAEQPAPNGGLGFNTAAADLGWGLMAICIGYGYDLLDIYASDLAEGTEPRRVTLAFDHPPHGTEVVTWADPEWALPDPWIELNGIRFTGFFIRGHRLAHHRAGTVTMAVNICGPHVYHDETEITTPTVGGPVMRVLDQAYRQLLFIINEHVAKNHGTGYRTGAHWPIETYDNGDPLFQTSQFEACQAMTVGWVGGLGHLAAISIAEPITVREFLRRFCRTFGCHIATNHHGQVFPLLIDPGVLPTTGRALRENIEIVDIDDAVLAHTEVLNRIVSQSHWDSDAKKFRAVNVLAENTTSIAAHTPGAEVGSIDRRGLRKEERDQYYTNDPVTAADVIAKELARRARRPRYVSVAVNLMGLDHDIGANVLLTHSDGLGVDGDVNVPMVVTEHTVDATPPATVTLRLQDLRTMT